MLFLFLQQICGFQIPVSTTYNSTIPLVSDEEFENVINTYSVNLIIIGFDYQSKRTADLKKTLTEASTSLPGKGKFIFLDETASFVASRQYKLSLPLVLFYQKGIPVSAFHYPESDSIFMDFVSQYVNPPYYETEISSTEDLVFNLSDGPFTILTTKSSLDQSLRLSLEAAPKMGPIHISKVTEDLLNQLDLDPNYPALFRREDHMIVSFRPRINDLYKASFPVFRQLTIDDLQGTDYTVFAIISPKFDESFKEPLFTLATEFPAFIVGYAGPRLRPAIEQVIGEKIGQNDTKIAIFNLDAGSHYNFTFEDGDLIDAGRRALSAIEDGSLLPDFITEDQIDADMLFENVTKLTGSTYESFINQPFDVMVLYMKDSCAGCKEFFPIFTSFAKECASANMDTKFAYIDVGKNTVQSGYPYMPSVPHVELFPINKSNHDMLRGSRTRDQMLLFMNMTATVPPKIPVPKPDKDAVALELFQMLFSSQNLPEEEQMRAARYITDISYLVGLATPTPTPDPKEMQDL